MERSLAQRLMGLLLFFVPEGLQEESEVLRRALIVVGVSLLLAALAIGPAFARFAIGGSGSRNGVILLCTALALACIPWVLRLTGSATLASTALLSICLTSLWLLVLFGGGLESGALIWIPLLVISSGFWAERDVLLFVAILATLCILGLYVTQSNGLLPPSVASPSQHFLVATLSSVSAVLLAALLAWLFENRRQAVEQQRDDLKKAMRSIFSASPDTIFVIDVTGAIVEAHYPVTASNWRPIAELAPSHLSEVLDDSVLMPILDDAQLVLDQQTTSISKVDILAGGSSVLCELRLVPYLKGFLLAVCRDVDEAEQLLRINSSLTRAISQELRVPIDSISRTCGLLSQSQLDALAQDTTEMFHTVKRQSGLLQRTLSDLIEFERLQFGKASIRLGPFQLCEFMEEIERVNQSVVARYDVSLVWKREGLEQEFQVFSDRVRLMQAISRLLWLFAEQLPPKSEISCVGCVDDDPSQVLIRSDFAPLPRDFIAQLYQHFKPADPATRSLRSQPSRIALWLIATVFDDLGVSTTFSSKEGDGSWFRLSFSESRLPTV